jgi:DNA-binding transcriptional ArsR family regulator
MCAVPEYEGLGDWLSEVRASLPVDLRQELCLLTSFAGRYQRFTEELSAALPASALNWSFDEFLAYLQTLPAVRIQHLALAALARAAEGSPPVDLLSLAAQPGDWAAYLASIESTCPPDQVARLVSDAGALQARLVAALRLFWHQAYADEFEATRPLLERSVFQHRGSRYGPGFHDVFVAVTGRLVPDAVAALLPAVQAVTFIPSCYVGPYVAYFCHGSSLIVFYNCRSAAAGAIALPTVHKAAIFPPLKALADETRLQILALLHDREFYAQEIVDRLNISQPAVSRHLNLMVAAGVLTMRREGNAKYYAVNRDVLSELARAFSSFV